MTKGEEIIIGICVAIVFSAAVMIMCFTTNKSKNTNTQYDLGYKQAVIEMYEHPELQKDMYKTAKGF